MHSRIQENNIIAMLETFRYMATFSPFSPCALRSSRSTATRIRAAKPAATFAWTCVSRSFVERRTSGLQHYLTSDVSTKAICSTARLPYITIWVEQARSRWERSGRNRDGVRGDLTFFLAHTVFALLVHARNRSRRVCFGPGAGGTAVPARRSHDKTRFFLPHTRRAASQSRMDEPRRVSPHGPALSPGGYVATTCTVWLGRRDQ